ncbi:MAG: hypothetical protein ACRDAM_13990 [Casimicrobium sp.]
MSETLTTQEKKKTGRPSRTLVEEIEATRLKLRELEEKQRREAKAKAERNAKDVHELLRLHKLDQVPIERWREAASEIAAALS